MKEEVSQEILEELRIGNELNRRMLKVLEDADAQLQSLPSGGGDKPPPKDPPG